MFFSSTKLKSKFLLFNPVPKKWSLVVSWILW
jgi:hypothetical protein